MAQRGCAPRPCESRSTIAQESIRGKCERFFCILGYYLSRVLFAMKTGSSFIPKRLLLAIETQPLAGRVAFVVHELRVVDRLLLGLDRLVEVPNLRVRSRECVQVAAVAVLDHVHGL